MDWTQTMLPLLRAFLRQILRALLAALGNGDVTDPAVKARLTSATSHLDAAQRELSKANPRTRAPDPPPDG